jgi:alpha-ketoglutarate-dependent taurine dioxygenase
VITGTRKFPDARISTVINARSPDEALHQFVMDNKPDILTQLQEQGAILFRGFHVVNVTDFQQFVSAVSSSPLQYVYRSTPRTRVAENIFTATEYPARMEIPLHNENAYQRKWPLKIAFCCLQRAEENGETPIADMRMVTASIGGEIMARFEERRVEYIRHYHNDIDLPWQEVFQTNSIEDVREFCARNAIHCEDVTGILRTSQVSQGVGYHPATHERLFFNQAHLFHVSSLGTTLAEEMMHTYGRAFLPRHARYGDGTEIDSGDLDVIRSAFRLNEVIFVWKRGDVLLADNMQVAHGRQSFKGGRQVLVALMDPSAPFESVELPSVGGSTQPATRSTEGSVWCKEGL